MAAFFALIVEVTVCAVLLLVTSIAIAVILIAASALAALAVILPVLPVAAIPSTKCQVPYTHAGTPFPPVSSRYFPRTVPRADGPHSSAQGGHCRHCCCRSHLVVIVVKPGYYCAVAAVPHRSGEAMERP